MDLRQLVMLALQVSILCTVFGFGLRARGSDLLYLIHRPGLLARSLLAVFVIMPIVAIVLVRTFDIPPQVKIVLVALAISPVPPLLPTKEARAGGDASFSLGLMAILSLVSIVAVPVAAEILGRYVGRPFAMSPSAIAGLVVKATLAPLAAGMVVRAFFPLAADRLERIVTPLVKVLLPVAAVALLASAMTAVWALIGRGAVLAMVAFILAGLATGHALGGRDRDHAVVLALSSACRHPAIALTTAATNFPGQPFGAILLLYLIVNAVVLFPYVAWQKRRGADGASMVERGAGA